ncbi:hypothetical protein WA026_017050 [Henosepilachna vigintioctopunctata]|uniref:Enhancer of mRNA-decapping protein 4 n=1 Tax=Henosepilachna vigintioctopunctata TaxID=420089 RepID=A0AAW1TYQ5_9CUCU
MNSPLLTLKNDKTQNVKSGTESDYTVHINSKDVVVHCKSGSHNHGSSKVKLTNMIDYNWELRYYQGQLVAVHIDGKVLAYAMKGKEGGMVRLANQETNQRALIKNLKTDVRDVSFAFLRNEIILGCVDDMANVFIYEIEDSPHFIKYKLLLHIFHPEALKNNASNYRMVWCPYLPSADDDPDTGDETAKMFVFLNGSKAEVWDVCSIISKCEAGPVEPDENHEGYVEIDHAMPLVDVSFSSDGTAIATACIDGNVKFYQVYMVDNEKQKKLHEWIPHEGKPLSCLIFIDNILEYSSDSRFWKFAITGASHNSELKFCIDHSGQYAVMSDINNKILYVLQIKRSDAEKLVAVKSISQFLLPAPFLSFHIKKAEVSTTPLISTSSEDLYNAEDYDEEETEFNSVNINLLVIQPKKFQECNIVFTPEACPSNIRDNSEEICDKLSPNEEEVENVPKLNDLQSSVELLIQQQTNKPPQVNLMTPEDFTPVANSRSSSVRNSLEPSQEKLSNLLTENLMEFERPQKGNFASGGSSPSREVQEILSLNSTNYSNPEYSTKLQESEGPSKFSILKESMFGESSSKELIWPKIPVVKDNGIVEEDNLTSDFNISKEENVREDLYKSHLQTLNFRLTSLETALREQTVLIENLKQEILSGKTKQNSINIEIRDDLSKELDVAMSKHQLQMAKFLENLSTMHKMKEREIHDSFVGNMSQIIHKTVAEKIQVIVSHELKALLPSIVSMIDMQFGQKVTQADLCLKDGIAKMVSSKGLTDTISRSVVNTVAPSLEKCYRDMITNSLIPSWEKVCGNMFQQINDTFTQGTKEYTAWVETYLDRQKKAQEKGKDLLTQINLATENMKISTDQQLNSVASEVQKHMNIGFKSIQENILASMREVICEEVRLGFKTQASVIEDSVINAVRSRSVTPASHMVDSHVKLSKIQQYLANGHVEEALKMSLSAENLQYVVYVCEKVDVNTVFGGSTVLPQSCLLALIQQLSMDLSKNTDVKLSYIHGAILGLDRNDPDTKRFVNKILKDLAIQLTSFINSNPPYKHKSSARMLLMAIENVGPSMFNISI